jgi:hypothetical protein
MSYRTPSRKSDPLTESIALGVRFPEQLVADHDALAVSSEHDRQAKAIANFGRKIGDEEYLANKAEHDAAEARIKAPADFEPYKVPRPDVGALQDLASIYDRNKRMDQRAVNAGLSDYGTIYKALDEAWRNLPAVDADTMTVSKAAGVAAERDEGRRILRAVNMASAKASGMTDGERKALLSAAKKDPDRLPNLDAIIAEARGTDEAAVKRQRAADSKAKAQRAAISTEAQASARARVGTQAKTPAEATA